MTKASITVNLPAGLNVENAEELTCVTVNYRSSISYTKGSFSANAKSVLSILASQVMYRDVLEFTCEGEDEQEAIDEIKEFFS